MRSQQTRRAWATALAIGSGLLGSVAFAQNAVPRAGSGATQSRRYESLQELVQTLRSRNAQPSAEDARTSIDPDGFLRHLGAPPGASFAPPLADPEPETVARAFLESCGRLLGTDAGETDFALFRTRSGAGGRTVLKFQQTFGGIPVIGSMAIVQLDSERGIESLMSDVAHDADGLRRALGLLGSVRPSQEIVVATVKSLEPVGLAIETTEPHLLLFVPQILGSSGDPVLVWEFETRGGIPETDRRFLIDATRGEVVRNYPLCFDALNRTVYDSANTSANPGTLSRAEGQGATGIADVDQAYQFLGDTYNFYFVAHGRDSIDGAGLGLSATVRYCDPGDPCPYGNAFWNGARMYFGQGFATDDVTAHELTHGVTQYESGLIYENHSGAINESLSDVWGEAVDFSNGANPLPWLIGEELPIGAIRSMSNPPAYGDPDRLGSPLFIPPTGTPNSGNDYGGVHTNSGVNNKLCYLLNNGGTFNGKTVLSGGGGAVDNLYYEAQVNLLMPGSNYTDLSFALQQAAVNLGSSSYSRANLYVACQAVEIQGGTGGFVVVNKNHVGIEDGSPANPFNTIGEGLAQLASGGHLVVLAGSYHEPLTTISVHCDVTAIGGVVTIGQ